MSMSAYAQDAKACLALEDNAVRNTCDRTLLFFYCVKGQCRTQAGNNYYTTYEELRPRSRLSVGRDTASLEVGACYGSFGTNITDNTPHYDCRPPTDTYPEIQALDEDADPDVRNSVIAQALRKRSVDCGPDSEDCGTPSIAEVGPRQISFQCPGGEIIEGTVREVLSSKSQILVVDLGVLGKSTFIRKLHNQYSDYDVLRLVMGACYQLDFESIDEIIEKYKQDLIDGKSQLRVYDEAHAIGVRG